MGESVDKMLVDMGKAKASGADLVEIRLDSLKSLSPNETLKTLIKECPLPTLFTYRFATAIFVHDCISFTILVLQWVHYFVFEV